MMKKVLLKTVIVILFVAVFMFVYEYIKEFYFPVISKWHSHIITIIFSTIFAGIISFFIFLVSEKYTSKIRNDSIFLNTLLDNIPVPIFYKDINGRYKGCNKNFLDFIGKEKKDIIGKSVYDMGPTEISKKYAEKDEELFKNPGKQKYEWNVKNSNGEIKNVILFKATYTDHNNEIIGLIGAILDITEIRILQNQLIQSEKLSAVGQLAAGIAHEFNNILAVNSVNAQLIELDNKDNLSESTLNCLKNISNSINRGKDIVSKMLTFAKPQIPIKKKCYVYDIISDVLELQKKQLQNEKVDYEIFCDKEIFLKVDRIQIEQVMLNLFINARQAIRPKETGKIIVECKKGDTNVDLYVKDNGIGMDENTKKKIFTPFFSTKGAYAKDNFGIEGTGLGLAICYMIIQNHNGTIEVTSEKNKGTKIYIKLPLDPNKKVNA